MRSPTLTIHISPTLSIKIKPSSNAWWKNKYQVYKLLAGLSVGMQIKDVCQNIGITIRKYHYFLQEHPQMKDVENYYRKQLIKNAWGSVEKKLKNKRFALRYLIKTQPDKFPPPSLQNKVKKLEEEIENLKKEYGEEYRQLKYIIDVYREASEAPSEESAKKLFAYGRKLIKDYNDTHYNPKKYSTKQNLGKIKEKSGNNKKGYIILPDNS